MTGEGGVAPLGLASDLAAKPLRWHEYRRLPLGVELHLGRVQSGQCAGVDVDVGDVIAEPVSGDPVAGLLDAASLCMWPQRLRLFLRDRHLHLRARKSTSGLDSEGRVPGTDPDPYDDVVLLGDVALPELLALAEDVGTGGVDEDEPPLDLGRHPGSMTRPADTSNRSTLGASVMFTARQQDAATAVAALTDLGFEFEPSRIATRTLLDTFDGRFHGADLRLELRQFGDLEPRDDGGLELVVSGPGAVPAQLGVDSVPRFAGDLPPGPFRARLAAIVDVRALLPTLRVTATQTFGVWRDRAGKTVTTVLVHEDVRVDDAPSADLPAWMIEVDELPGYPKRAEKACDVLDRIGLERVDGELLTIAARASGVDLDGFTDSPTVPLDRTLPAVDGFRAVLANLADTIVANWQGTVDEIDPEFLHDLRVAVRRTRSVVSQGKKVLPPAIVEQARERFGWLADLTGPARDLDVYLIEWDGYTRPLGPEVVAALDPVRLLLQQRHAAAYATLIGALRSPDANEWMSTWRTWLREPISAEAEQGIHADRPLGHVVRKRITRTQTQLVEDGRLIRSDTPAEQVHDLRKDAKKLRYLFECFASLLPKAPRKKFVRRLKVFQDNLGEHQDSEVHIAVLRDISRELYAAGVASDTMVAIGQLSERLDQRRIAARVEFTERFADYDTKSTRRALAAALDGLT